MGSNYFPPPPSATYNPHRQNLYIPPPVQPSRRKSPLFYLLALTTAAVFTHLILNVSKLARTLQFTPSQLSTVYSIVVYTYVMALALLTSLFFVLAMAFFKSVYPSPREIALSLAAQEERRRRYMLYDGANLTGGGYYNDNDANDEQILHFSNLRRSQKLVFYVNLGLALLWIGAVALQSEELLLGKTEQDSEGPTKRWLRIGLALGVVVGLVLLGVFGVRGVVLRRSRRLQRRRAQMTMTGGGRSSSWRMRTFGF